MKMTEPSFDTKHNNLTPNTSAIYNQNIKIISECCPELLQKISSRDSSIELFLNYAGHTIPDVTIKDQDSLYTVPSGSSENNICDIKNTCLSLNVHILNLSYLMCHISLGFELATLYEFSDCPVAEVPDLNIPIYVIEPNLTFFIATLCLVDITSMVKSKRVLFFIGKNAIDDYAKFLNTSLQLLLPIKLFHLNGVEEDIFNAVIEITNKQAEVLTTLNNQNIESNRLYYDSLTPFYELSGENSRNPIVLGFAPRFTSYLKHCMRDLLEGFKFIGCQTIKYTEHSNIERMTNQDVNQVINQIKPDVILFINHFRLEQTFFSHDKIIFINWIQDLLPNILEPQFESLKTTDLTFVFNQSWVDFLKSKPTYANGNVFHLPIGFNSDLYYKIPNYTKLYDVVYISHIPDPNTTFFPIRENHQHFKLMPREVEFVDRGLISFEKLILTYMLVIKIVDNMLMDDLAAYIFQLDGKGVDSLANRCLVRADVEPHPDLIGYFKSHYTRFYNDLLLTQKIRPIASLIDAEINVRVYGRNWDKINKFKSVHGGIAHNGVNLNKILNRSKICLNNSPLSFHMLALEALGSGTFLLSRKIKYDHANIFCFFSEQDETPSYTNEIDIAQKVNFYLKSPKIRSDCAENAHQKALDRYTHKHTATKILSTIYDLWNKFPNNLSE